MIRIFPTNGTYCSTANKTVKQYVYDPAGNILSKTVNGKTTAYTYDKANQLVTSTADGKVTNYQYDAAGRLVKEGNKTYTYGYLDKVLAVQENGKRTATFDYHIDGQIASATHGDKKEDFLWDGLALIHRGKTSYINEPYVTGGNPILSSKDGVMFNDMLGSSLNIGGKPVSMTAFGECVDSNAMYTGKPCIGELGYAFLFRNYRPDYSKWQTTDPLGYPDGWNNLAYVNNKVNSKYDRYGLSEWFQGNQEPVVGRIGLKTKNNWINLEPGGWMTSPFEEYVPNFHRTGDVHDSWVDALTGRGVPDLFANVPTMIPAYIYALGLNLYEDGSVAFWYSVDIGTDIYEWTMNAAQNWLVDPMENLFNQFLNDAASIFISVYNLVTPNGRPE